MRKKNQTLGTADQKLHHRILRVRIQTMNSLVTFVPYKKNGLRQNYI